MVRYIIPFDYQSRNFYVFIEKHPGSNHFEITQLVPETSEVVVRQIPVQAVKAYKEPVSKGGQNLNNTIICCLAIWLREKGWPVEESQK